MKLSIFRVQYSLLIFAIMSRLLLKGSWMSLLQRSMFYRASALFIVSFIFYRSKLFSILLLGILCFYAVFNFIVLKFNWRLLARCLSVIAIFIIGVAYAFYNDPMRRLRTYHVMNSWLHRPQQVDAVVLGIPEESPYRMIATLKTKTIAGSNISQIIRLTWYGRHPAMMVGDNWHLYLKLRAVVSLKKHRSFNYAQWLAANNIYLLATVIPGYKVALQSYDNKTHNKLLGHNSWYKPVTYLRQRVMQHIVRVIHNPQLSAFIAALCTGSRSTVSKSQWRVLANTGTNHLIAIAGLHLGMMVSISYFVVRYLPCWRFLYFYRPIMFYAGGVSLLLAFIYSLMAGFALPTLRALFMLAFCQVATLIKRPASFFQRWIFSMLLLIILLPDIVYQPSFWLSFSAVLLIIYAISQFAKQRKMAEYCHANESNFLLAPSTLWQYFKNEVAILWRVQWALFIGLLPLTAYFFKTLSLVMIPANLVAVPVISWLVLPMVWAACVSWGFSHFVSDRLFHLAAVILHPVWCILQKLSGESYLIYQLPKVSLFALFVALIGVYLMLNSYLRWYWRVLALLLWCPLLL